MSVKADQYCLDANVLIEAWRKYYNPQSCPDYWNILIEIGKLGNIFIPELVTKKLQEPKTTFQSG